MLHLSRIRRSFTIIELLVSVVILVALIFAIGIMFRTTARAVGTSEASLELLSNVRAAQDQIARDLHSFDASTFMVIRHRTVPRPLDLPPSAEDIHVDQIAFIANGDFPYKLPSDDPAPLGDHTAHAALIWYGHLVVEGRDIPLGNSIAAADQGKPLRGPRTRPLDVVPSGRSADDFILGRHATLLLSPTSLERTKEIIGSQILPAYPDPTIYGATASFTDEAPAHITSSRLSLCSATPSQIMQEIIYNNTVYFHARELTETSAGLPPPITETAFCYRFKTLLSPWDTEIRQGDLPSLANGVQRMSSIFLQGAFSFEIGVGHGGAPHVPGNDTNFSGDDDVEIFSYDTSMPASLTITLRVVDPTHRFPTGRTFQQTVLIPHAKPMEFQP